MKIDLYLIFQSKSLPNFYILGFSLIMLLSIANAQDQTNYFNVNGGYTLDLASNINGGLDHGFAYLGNLDLTFSLDTGKANLWKGGTFFTYLLNNHGNLLSELTGDFQIANNIEANNNIRLYEFWYQHQFKSLSITIGQHNLNSVFALSKTGSFFINSSFGIQPDISVNIPTSIFPVAGLGIIFSWKASPKLNLNHGIYDGDPGTEDMNPNSLQWSINRKDGCLLINELQYNNTKEGLTLGTYKLGFWNHTQNITIKNENQYNSQGIYFIGDQNIYRETDSNQGLMGFIQWGISLNKLNPLKSYRGFGLVYQGIFSEMDDDIFGFALANAIFSNSHKSKFTHGVLKNETTLELSYEFVFNNKFSLKPNFQYIINPGSTPNINNALIGLLRLYYSW